jgi:hypothetical protein
MPEFESVDNQNMPMHLPNVWSGLNLNKLKTIGAHDTPLCISANIYKTVIVLK